MLLIVCENSFAAAVYVSIKRASECSAARLAHLSGGQGVVGSNPATPTTSPAVQTNPQVLLIAGRALPAGRSQGFGFESRHCDHFPCLSDEAKENGP